MAVARMIWSELTYQQRSYWRNPVSAFFTFFLPIMFLVIFGSLDSGSKLPTASGAKGLNYDQYFVPAILTFGVISSCYTNLSIQLTTQREEGLLKRIRSSPLPPWAYLFTVVLSSLVRAALLVGLTMLVGGLFYHVVYPAHSVLALVVTIAVGAAAFCAIGIAITVVIPNADAAPAVVNGIYLPIVFLSGTFFPIAGTSVLAKIAAYFPVRPFVLATFNAMNPRVSGSGFEGSHVLDMAVWGVVALALAVRRFRWVPTRKS
jgi:ABC-2 type transport system permease protein